MDADDSDDHLFVVTASARSQQNRININVARGLWGNYTARVDEQTIRRQEPGRTVRTLRVSATSTDSSIIQPYPYASSTTYSSLGA